MRVSSPAGTTFADVNGDGYLDLLVTALGKGTRLFLNDGKAHFKEAFEIPVLIQRFGGRSLALADIDGDGDLDLYVANYRTTTVRDSPVAVKVKKVGGKWEVPPEHRDRFIAEAGASDTVASLELGEPDILYRNDGRGHFEPVSWTDGHFLDEGGKPCDQPTSSDWGLSAMFRDVNGDGLPDLDVCNDYFTPDRLWINQGKGVFRALCRRRCARPATLPWRLTLRISTGTGTMTSLSPICSAAIIYAEMFSIV